MLGRLVSCWSLYRRQFPHCEPASADGQSQRVEGPRGEHDAETPAAIAVKHDYGLWLLAVVAAVMIFTNLGFPLSEPDETRYAHVARQMLDRGDWLVPRRAGEPFLDKPPLTYWFMAASMSVFGKTEFAARFPLAVCGWLGVMLTWAIGRQFVGSRGALFGAFALLLAGGYVLSSRYILTDMVLTLFVVLGTWSAWNAVRTTTFRRSWWYLAAVSCGMAVLCKGPIGLVLPALPVVASGLLGSWRSRPKWHDWAGAWTVTIVLSTWWFVAVALAEPEFGPYFFYRQNFVRFTDAFDHREPWWYYGPALLIGMLPASAMLPGVLLSLCSRKSFGTAMRDASTGFLLLASASTVTLFSLSECKLPTYILPAIPSLALLIGAFVDRVLVPAVQRNAVAVPRPALTFYLSHLRRDLPYVAVPLVVLAGIALVVATWIVSKGSVGLAVVSAVLVLAALAFVAVTFALTPANPERRLAIRWAGAIGSTLVLVMTGFTVVYPTAIRYRSYMLHAKELAQELDATAPVTPPIHNDVQIVFVGALPHGSEFVLPQGRTHAIDLNKIEQFAELAELAEQDGELIVIAPPKSLPLLEPALSDRVTWEHRGSRGFIHILRPRSTTLTPEPVPIVAGAARPAKTR